MIAANVRRLQGAGDEAIAVVEHRKRQNPGQATEHVLYARRIRNFTGQPIDVEIRRSFAGHATFQSELRAERHDYNTVVIRDRVEDRSELLYELTTRHGSNAKQNNVTILDEAPSRT